MFNSDCVSFSSSIVIVPYVIILSVSICISSLLVWISINKFKTCFMYVHTLGCLAQGRAFACDWDIMLIRLSALAAFLSIPGWILCVKVVRKAV